MSVDYLMVAVFLGGFFLAVYCAFNWRRNSILMFLPLAYAFGSDAAVRVWRDLSLEWEGPIGFAVMYYILGWVHAEILRRQQRNEKKSGNAN